MDLEDRSDVVRYARSALLALPITVALIYLMTQLILPAENDRVVSRMIEAIELRRAIRRTDPAPILTPASPTERRPLEEDQPVEPQITENELVRPLVDTDPRGDTELEDGEPEAASPEPVDWWAAARNLNSKLEREATERWLLNHGYVPYVTSMQGDTPTLGRAVREPTEGTRYGMPYMNTYGLTEIQINENCIATTQFEGRFGNGELAKYLPMNISCKKKPKQKFSFDRE